MARDSAIPPESFEEILAWLNSDRDMAGAMYVQLRENLARLFVSRQCADPEGLTDEVFDRVAKKVHEIRPGYVGDPRVYFYAVANKLVKENFRKIKTHASLDEIEPSRQIVPESKEEEADIADCLDSWLRAVSSGRGEGIRECDGGGGQAKSGRGREVAERCGVGVGAGR